MAVWRQNILDRGCTRQRGKCSDLGQALDRRERPGWLERRCWKMRLQRLHVYLHHYLSETPSFLSVIICNHPLSPFRKPFTLAHKTDDGKAWRSSVLLAPVPSSPEFLKGEEALQTQRHVLWGGRGDCPRQRARVLWLEGAGISWVGWLFC